MNDIFYNSEKKGVPSKLLSELDEFRNAFIDNGLYDLGFTGYEFAWSNYRENDVMVEERLDRFCADTEWSLIFLDATVSLIDFDFLDHLPIALNCKPRVSRGLTSNAVFSLRICGLLIPHVWM